jgi:hypothetical protein
VGHDGGPTSRPGRRAAVGGRRRWCGPGGRGSACGRGGGGGGGGGWHLGGGRRAGRRQRPEWAQKIGAGAAVVGISGWRKGRRER